MTDETLHKSIDSRRFCRLELHLFGQLELAIHGGTQFLMEQLVDDAALVRVGGRFGALKRLRRELAGEVACLALEVVLEVLGCRAHRGNCLCFYLHL